MDILLAISLFLLSIIYLVNIFKYYDKKATKEIEKSAESLVKTMNSYYNLKRKNH